MPIIRISKDQVKSADQAYKEALKKDPGFKEYVDSLGQKSQDKSESLNEGKEEQK
jgi:hypothetical protein